MAGHPEEIGCLGGYRLLKVLGAGGLGVVFQAEDPQRQGPLAIKMLRPALAIKADARARFLLEARRAAAVAHGHIVPIYQVGEENGMPFLAMPLLCGESLETRLQREGKLPLEETLRIGREIGDGLAAAHARGLIHGGIKPANIWLEAIPRGRVKILDFGLAQAGRDPSSSQWDPAYLAPEQPSGQPVDSRCDLFSFGCVLYRLCTGRAPFQGPDTMTILAAVALEDPAPPHALEAAVPAALSELIMEMLAKKGADRPPSAAAVLAVLDSLRVPDGIPDRTEPVALARGRRRRARWIAAAVLLTLLGGGWLVAHMMP